MATVTRELVEKTGIAGAGPSDHFRPPALERPALTHQSAQH